MYLSILKHDLKRKKAMNTILLIFITLSVMFISSSVNTVMSVITATDSFMDISGAKDYFIATRGINAQKELDKKLSSLSCVKSVKSEKIMYNNENSVRFNGKIVEINGVGVLNSIDDIGIKVF